MEYLRKYPRTSRRKMTKYHLSTYLFIFDLVSVFVSWTLVDARSSRMVVSRISDGDKFTNPSLSDKRKHCLKMNAHCVDDLSNSCNECKCRTGNETYLSDEKRCVSSEQLDNITGCTYKVLQDPRKGIVDVHLATLDLSKKNIKNIRAPIRMPTALPIKCGIDISSSYISLQGTWTALPNISDVLKIDVTRDRSASVKRYLNLNWEGVSNTHYSGLLIKLQIVCKSDSGPDSEANCFLFKSRGRNFDDTVDKDKRDFSTTTRSSSGPQVHTVFSKVQKTPTAASTQQVTTERNVVDSHSYSVSRYVIVGVSTGLGLVILVIIILAVCCVRRRTRKPQETLPVVNTDAPKVHFTAETRFSLIQEAAPIDPETSDYTCLQDNRERYDPYCSLRKDDVDLNVIDQILKDAVSMESMEPSSEPRYSCRLSGDQTIIIESARLPRSPKTPKYHVLEGPDESNEPDYEEVDSSDEEDATVAARLLDTKPPLPEREYHVLGKPVESVQSDC